MSFLFHAARRRLLGGSLASLVLLAACGGGDDAYWDAFVPREATVADLDDDSFLFTDFSYGAVFDPSLSTTSTTLAFGAAGTSGLPFSLLARGASASGRAQLAAGVLTLNYEAVGAGLPFAGGQVQSFDIQADVADGRIRLTNRSSAVEQTSAPR